MNKDQITYIDKKDLLIVSENIGKDEIIYMLFHHSGHILYVCDEVKLCGIISTGDFMAHYNEKDVHINYNCFRLNFGEDNEKEALSIFENHNKIRQIPVVGPRGELLGEYSREYQPYSSDILSEEKRCFVINYYAGIGKKVVFAECLEDRHLEADIYFVKNIFHKFIFEVLVDKEVLLFHYTWEADLCLLMEKAFNRGIKILYFASPSVKSGFPYPDLTMKRMKNELRFPEMAEDFQTYKEDFDDIYGDESSEEFIAKLSEIPPIVKVGNRTYHMEAESELVNIIAGKRFTEGQPRSFLNNIYVYGNCSAFGYAVADCNTLPSYLQKKINNVSEGIKVENLGVWGADTKTILDNMWEDINFYSENDIIIMYMHPLEANEINKIKKLNVEYYDCTDIFHRNNDAVRTIFDRPGHMGKIGYSEISEYIFKNLYMKNYLKCGKMDSVIRKENEKTQEEMPRLLETYLNHIKSQFPIDYESKRIGSIVMNCNPFTFGHQYLIKYASSHVDYLFVFVVEEDRSYFKFKDRFSLVQAGIHGESGEELKNVFVVGSGSFIISTETFPQYFMKEQDPEASVDPIADITLFGRYIAPALNIRIRFAGTEPKDLVTKQYNIVMQNELHKYGVEFCEIPRKTMGDDVISASTVRRLYENGDYIKIKELVPASTYHFLMADFEKTIN